MQLKKFEKLSPLPPLKTELIDTKNKLVVARGGEQGSKMGESYQKVQTSRHKISHWDVIYIKQLQ